MRFDALLIPRPEGLYCPPGGFYIDPVRPVPRALVTHGHADHATPGHGAVMATAETLDIMAIRQGERLTGTHQPVGYGEALDVNGVRVSFHPAGHVLGSAQIAVEHRGLRAVVTGDYKRGRDPTCAPWEPVPCDLLITEATFGLPVFRHPDPRAEIARLLASLDPVPRAHPPRRRLRPRQGAAGDPPPARFRLRRPDLPARRAPPALRLLRRAGHRPRPARERHRRQGPCQPFRRRGRARPPSAFAATWVRRFADPLIAFASGWMQVRARRRQRGVELPLIISDHADWPELTATIAELAPAEVWVTHGREEALVRWCALNGVPARPLHMVGYEDEAE
jgi:putative mRNA 3-end processing factor